MDAFWAGFEKRAGLVGAVSSTLGRAAAFPAVAKSTIKNLPGAAKGAVKSVERKAVKTKENFATGFNRAKNESLDKVRRKDLIGPHLPKAGDPHFTGPAMAKQPAPKKSKPMTRLGAGVLGAGIGAGAIVATRDNNDQQQPAGY